MEGAWLAAAHFATAALMLLLAGLLLWLDAGRAPVRAFVAFLVLRAGSVVAVPLAQLLWASDPRSATALGQLNVYLHIASAGSVAYFVATYPRTARPWVRVAVLLATLGALAANAAEPCLVICSTPAGVARGPLALLTQALPIALAAAALVLFARSRRLEPERRRVSARFVATALAIESALVAGVTVAVLSPAPPLISTVPLFAAIVAAAGATYGLRGRPRSIALLILALAFASAFIGVRAGDAGALSLGTLLIGAWRLATPGIVGYALARHRLFDLDLRMRMVAKKATIGAVFAGIFFVVTESAAYVLGNLFGVLAGIVAVGVFFPLIGPLRRAGERLSDLLPGDDDPPHRLPIEQRRHIYREFALQAWGDGAMARSERAFLDQLRERLALSADDALRLETEASEAPRSV